MKLQFLKEFLKLVVVVFNVNLFQMSREWNAWYVLLYFPELLFPFFTFIYMIIPFSVTSPSCPLFKLDCKSPSLSRITAFTCSLGFVSCFEVVLLVVSLIAT